MYQLPSAHSTLQYDVVASQEVVSSHHDGRDTKGGRLKVPVSKHVLGLLKYIRGVHRHTAPNPPAPSGSPSRYFAPVSADRRACDNLPAQA